VPGAPDLATAIDDEEVIAPVLRQPDRRAQAGEAAADDQGADVAAWDAALR
jgi:hypothetical protein